MRIRRGVNIDGAFYVDDGCINCGTCYGLAPLTFKEVHNQSAVFNQPVTLVNKKSAIEALVSCPVGSIHNGEKSEQTKEVIESFPLAVEENVYYCGFNSEKSYGASSYFIRREEGNVLVDSPRFVPQLVKKFEEFGGIKYLYLTHRDDVADHDKFKKHFHCQEILHKDDYRDDFGAIDILIEDHSDFDLAPDLKIIFTPGHTKGHTVLLYKNKFLFTGDHLAWDSDRKSLSAFDESCWYSWPEQIKSMKKLLDYSFQFVLPGHGQRFSSDASSMKKSLEQCITWMESSQNRQTY
jgi:glyoxylase-like metal-dependent hydrolase (beta-lactamase superfamily II)/ferredoxin